MTSNTTNEWRVAEDNLFSGNHRTKMIANGNGTMAQVYTVEELEKEFNKRKYGNNND